MTGRRSRLGITVATILAVLASGAQVTRADNPPPAPTNVSATSTNGQVDVTWSPVAGAVGYNVYRDSVVPGPTATFVGAGDIASCTSNGDEATALLLDSIPGTVFALGDNVYEDGTAAEFANCYEPTWGRHKARTRPAVGNHEYQTANAAPYFQYFGAAAGDATKGYYSYDLGSWHVIVLNSACWIVSCAAGSPQEQWLRSDLAAAPAQCVVAYWHHPRFSSGSEHGSDLSVAPFWDALYDADADLILNGHDHIYERFAPQTPAGTADSQRGLRQFNVGTGGRSHYGVGTIKANSEIRDVATYGVLRLTLQPGAYDWTFVPEAGRSFTDTGTGSCHDANGPVTRSGPRNGGTPLAGTTFTDSTVTAGTEYHYVVTSVDGTGQESAPSASATVTVTGGSGPVIYALDTFGRNVVDGFGSTNPGGTYSLQGTAADFDVGGATGTIALSTASASRAAVLPSVAARDVDLSFRFATNKLATGSGQYVYGVVRRVSASASYWIKVKIAPAGAVWVGASSVTNNVETPIGSDVRVANLTQTPDGFIRVRAEVTGASPTTIRIRAWADGTTEPTTWTYTGTDSVAALQAPGGVGLRAYLASATTNAPVLVTVDDLRAAGLGGTGSNTPPVVDSVSISPSAPTTNQVLTATATAHDVDGGPVTLAYQWLRNDVPITGATGSTLDLAGAGNGDRGDQIKVRATASDGQATSSPVTSAAVVVANTAPSATVSLGPPAPSTDATLTAAATKADADGNAVALTFAWSVNGTVRRTVTSSTALTDTFDLSTAGNGDPGDVVQVEVTPADDATNGTPASATVTVTGGSGPVIYALDTFGRNVVDGFGSTNPGGTYSLQGTAADFDVGGATGTIALSTASASRAAVLPSVAARDVDLSFRFATNKLATGSGQYVYGVVRRVSASASYWIKVKIAPAGAVWVGASSVTNNVETPIGSDVRVANLTQTPDGFIRVRAEVTGASPTTIRIRAWADGTTEPTTWTYTGTDSVAALQAPGGVGLRAYLASATTNAPVLVTVDDLRAAGLGGTGSNTPPVVDSVSISPSAPTTNQVLTATATAHDVDGGPVTLAYQWLRNDVPITGATGSTLDLAGAGNGDRGDQIKVRATASDGQATSSPVTSAAVVVAKQRLGPG